MNTPTNTEKKMEETGFQAMRWLEKHPYFTATLGGLLLYFLLVRITMKLTGKRLPPGPRGLPLIGNAHQLEMKVLHQSLANLSNKYGDIMQIRLGPICMVVISSPLLAEEILKTQDHIFCSRPRNIAGEIFGVLALSPPNETWRKFRRLLNAELMIPKRLQQSENRRRIEILKTMNRILELGAKGNPVNMSSILSELAFDISTQNFFGKSYHGHKTSVTNSTTDERKDLPTLILQVVENAMFVPGDIYPMLRKLDIGGVEAALLSLRKELDDLFTSIFEEHRNKAERKETTVATEDSDFLDVLLSLQSENTEYSLTDREIKSLLYDLMLAGTDTISAQVIWIMTDIMRHPEVLQELHKELDSVVGRGRMVEVSDLVHMKYLKAVIKECIRLHPGLPLGAPHQSMQATKVAGYHIPAGSRVFINLWAIGRDSRVWENPMDFNPGRFFSSPIDLKGQHFQLLPFGSGRRICPAMNLGIQMMQLIVAQLFHTCDFSVPQGMGPGNVDVQEEFHGASRKKIPLELLVAPRLPPHAYDLHTAC